MKCDIFWCNNKATHKHRGMNICDFDYKKLTEKPKNITIEERLYNLKIKIILTQNIDFDTRTELADDIFEIEKLITKQ